MSLQNAVVEANGLATGVAKIKSAFGFWLIIAFLIGVSCGLYIGKEVYSHKMDEAVKMQRIVYDQVVYDLMVFDKGTK